MTPNAEVYEKLGAFYLGKVFDQEAGKPTDDLLLYDSKDLLTHAVCVGMTGSGKTGLCLSLLEEAAIDGIPALVIDPKGDLGNLLLTFPNLEGQDFRPWIDPAEAQRQGKTPDEFAAAQAATWKNGLAEWGQDGQRIARLKAAADFAIYTPGSEAGLPVSILASFGPPPPAVRSDNDLLAERVASTAASLLGLLGVDADPLRSREHILLSNLLDHAWRQGQGYDLGGLIRALQNPPFDKVGVFDLEAFFPSKDRLGLAMMLNNLLAAPGFGSWFSGEPLEIDRILYTPAGKPRIAIFSIAHLSDAERMFFVSLLLNQTLAWMRQRPGSTSLQALLYMDEVFGFMPPVANPPSKQAMLTLLKQARAFGLGIMLATQNPVDLDYKGLSNTGTWFLGRLQTEQDKARILDGLAGASGAGFDRGELERLLSGLGKRVFLLHNVHESGPVLFQTRWALSYLRGPMTRVEIQAVMAGAKAAAPAPTAAPAPRTASAGGAGAAERPVLPNEIQELFLPAPGGGGPHYRPGLLALAAVHFSDAKAGVDTVEESLLFLPLEAGALRLDWESAEKLELDERDLLRSPAAGAGFDALPGAAAQKSSYAAWERELVDFLYRTRRYELAKSALTGAVSRPGETERDFRIRQAAQLREERDAAVEKLRTKAAPKLARIEERIRSTSQKLDREKAQVTHQGVQTALSLGKTVLGALFGRKLVSRSSMSGAGSTFRGVARTARERQDVVQAEESLEALHAELANLEAEMEREVAALTERYDPQAESLETVALRPKKSDVDVRFLALGWQP